MRGAWIALLALGAATPAFGAHALGLDKATRVANHVRHLEAHNHFGLRARVGGAFKLDTSSCDPNSQTPRRMVCSYNATGLDVDENGMRMRCAVDVTVRLHGLRRTTWRRHLVACVRQSWSAP